MKRISSAVSAASMVMQWIAGTSLVLLMLTTVTDVLLRNVFGKPIPGTYELVGFAGGLVIGLALPMTSWRRGHVEVDSFLPRLPARPRAVIQVLTRVLGAALFAILAWNLFRLGLDLRASGEVSPTLELRFYPVLFGLALAGLLQTCVLCGQIGLVLRGEYE